MAVPSSSQQWCRAPRAGALRLTVQVVRKKGLLRERAMISARRQAPMRQRRFKRTVVIFVEGNHDRIGLG